MAERYTTAVPETFWELYAPADSDTLPKHAALRRALHTAIADGFWTSGDKLPTEAELARACPFSLGTVQRAMRDLGEQGIVERHRRRGTYVARGRPLADPWHCRFLAEDGKSFLPVYTRVVERTTTQRQGPWSQALRQTDETVIRIDRHMEINSEFIVYSKFFARADLFSTFLELPLEELSGANLKKLLIESTGSPLSVIHEELRMSKFPSFVCKEIGVADGTVGLHIHAVAFSADDLPVYYQELYVPPTERRLHVESRL